MFWDSISLYNHYFEKEQKKRFDNRYRRGKLYNKWRAAVLKRDKYTCQCCGAVGDMLEAHHIKEFSKYPELSVDVGNGLALCHSCHIKTDNYGTKSLTDTPRQLENKRIKKYIAEHLDCSWEEVYNNVPNHFIKARHLAGTVLSWKNIDLSKNKNLHPEIYIPRYTG